MRTMWLLGAALVVAGCGDDEPYHTEAPPRVLERVTRPVKKKDDGGSTGAKKGGFDFSKDDKAGGREGSATPRNVVAPELEDLERLMAREGREAAGAASGVYECKRCGQQASHAGKCCGTEREKIG